VGVHTDTVTPGDGTSTATAVTERHRPTLRATLTSHVVRRELSEVGLIEHYSTRDRDSPESDTPPAARHRHQAARISNTSRCRGHEPTPPPDTTRHAQLRRVAPCHNGRRDRGARPCHHTPWASTAARRWRRWGVILPPRRAHGRRSPRHQRDDEQQHLISVRYLREEEPHRRVGQRRRRRLCRLPSVNHVTVVLDALVGEVRVCVCVRLRTGVLGEDMKIYCWLWLW
jgi:hypothetical protein